MTEIVNRELQRDTLHNVKHTRYYTHTEYFAVVG